MSKRGDREHRFCSGCGQVLTPISVPLSFSGQMYTHSRTWNGYLWRAVASAFGSFLEEEEI